MGINVHDTDQYVLQLDTRMPFHFGNVTVERAVRTVVVVEIEVDGATQTGFAMGTIGSGWFLKDPSISLSELVERYLDVTGRAREHVEAVGAAPTVFELWRETFERQEQWAATTDHPPLLWGYGVSLVEQAVIDAFCRCTGTRFSEAVRDGSLGLELGMFYDELASESASALLPSEPLRTVAIRHTVGLTDPLTDGDLAPADRLDDGLPQTMAEYIEEQGINRFKLKLGADLDADRRRLRRISAVIDSALDEYAFTVDANEQYPSAAAFRNQWTAIVDDPELSAFFDDLLYVEQPLPRDEAFTDDTARTFSRWDDCPPIIIDESDDRPDRLGTALDCGYAGTSHKNCKGVFKGVANRCLIEHRRRTDPAGEYVMSGEDLTTTGPIELQEDFAVMATLGMDHVERNGHHYFTGMSDFPEEIQETVLDAHSDLFRRHERGFITLDCDDGTVRLDSVLDAPFGHAIDLTLDRPRFIPVEEWSPSLLDE